MKVANLLDTVLVVWCSTLRTTISVWAMSAPEDLSYVWCCKMQEIPPPDRGSCVSCCDEHSLPRYHVCSCFSGIEAESPCDRLVNVGRFVAYLGVHIVHSRCVSDGGQASLQVSLLRGLMHMD